MVYVSAVLAIYAKSACQTSNQCQYKREVSNYTFTVKLNVTEEPGVKYYCFPDVSPPSLVAKVCVAVKSNHFDSKFIVFTALLGQTSINASHNLV